MRLDEIGYLLAILPRAICAEFPDERKQRLVFGDRLQSERIPVRAKEPVLQHPVDPDGKLREPLVVLVELAQDFGNEYVAEKPLRPFSDYAFLRLVLRRFIRENIVDGLAALVDERARRRIELEGIVESRGFADVAPKSGLGFRLLAFQLLDEFRQCLLRRPRLSQSFTDKRVNAWQRLFRGRAIRPGHALALPRSGDSRIKIDDALPFGANVSVNG